MADDVAALGNRFTRTAPARSVGVYMWVIVTANALAWLSGILPVLISGGPTAFLRGTGLPANPR